MTKIQKHAHKSSLHLSAVMLAGLSFLGANEAALESQAHHAVEQITTVIAEREIPHTPIVFGAQKNATVSGA